MKMYSRVAVLSVVVILVLLTFFFLRRTSAPESSIIAAERNKLAASQDKQRMESDIVYAHEFRSKLRFLDHRLAVAYNKENRPEAAIEILEKLVNDEELKNRDGDAARNSRSYLEEARYYETLQEAYVLKNDKSAAEKAGRYRDELMSRAETAKKQERLEDGKSLTEARKQE